MGKTYKDSKNKRDTAPRRTKEERRQHAEYKRKKEGHQG